MILHYPSHRKPIFGLHALNQGKNLLCEESNPVQSPIKQTGFELAYPVERLKETVEAALRAAM